MAIDKENSSLSDSERDKLLGNDVEEDSVFSNTPRRSSASSDSGNAEVFRSRFSDLFRSKSLKGNVKTKRHKQEASSALVPAPPCSNAIVPVSDKKSMMSPFKRWTTIVTVVLVKAKGLPDPLEDGASHNVCCEIRLGSEKCKSKSVPNRVQPEWRERFNLHLYADNMLTFTLWDKGKQKNFMGSTTLDLSKYERERTHEVWQELDDGFGTIHFALTMCDVKSKDPTTPEPLNFDSGVVRAKHAIHNLKSDWRLVGQLHVVVAGARGLCGRPSAYCTLEVDNERIQTPAARASSEPAWNKSYIFNVYDVSSTLDLKVYDSSLVNALRGESLGRISIPLLRINNGEQRWFALKNKTNKRGAKGNCPRIQLEMTMFWNPVKATARLFQPKEVKYLKKPPKFDVALVYSNMEFIRDTFNALGVVNENYKRLFEWENQELSFAVLVCWLVFWYYFRMWAAPLLLLIPFFYFWVSQSNQADWSSGRTSDDNSEQNQNDKNERRLTGRIQEMPELTLTITGGVEYSVSLAERLYNLASFKVPFLSFVCMIMLVASAFSFYFIPFNYMMMAFGIHKFTRKYLNPERILNNDILDFISRIPDNEILKDWKELNVPEPSALKRQASTRRKTSDSS